jgi:hypothetical protein
MAKPTAKAGIPESFGIAPFTILTPASGGAPCVAFAAFKTAAAFFVTVSIRETSFCQEKAACLDLRQTEQTLTNADLASWFKSHHMV